MRISQSSVCNTVAAAVLLSAISLNAQIPAAAQPKSPYVPVRLDPYIAVCSMWRTDYGYRSTIRLKNELAVSAMEVTLTLYMADGTPYELPAVHLGKSSVA